jgi:hypothetical protein
LGGEDLTDGGQQFVDMERFEHDADAQVIEVLGHHRVVDRPDCCGTQDQRDTSHVGIELGEREERPARLLVSLEEQVLDNDVGARALILPRSRRAMDVVTR